MRSHLTYAFGVYVSGIYPDTHVYMQVGASRDHEVRVVLAGVAGVYFLKLS